MRDEVFSSVGYAIGVVTALYAVGSPFFGPGFGISWVLGLTWIISLALFSCWQNYGHYVQFSLNSIPSFPMRIVWPREKEDTRSQSIVIGIGCASVLASFWLPVVYLLYRLAEYLNPLPLLANYIPFVFGFMEAYTNNLSSRIVLDVFSTEFTGVYAVMVVFYIGIIVGTYLHIFLAQFAYFDRKLFWPLSNKFFSSAEWSPIVSEKEALYADIIFMIFSILLFASVILMIFNGLLGGIGNVITAFSRGF